MVKVVLPFHLRNLAGLDGPEVELEVAPRVTLGAVLDALEMRYPTLRGTIRDPLTQKRRPFVRFYACKEDWSHEAADINLPVEVANGTEPFYVVGAMAGG
jgi:molybdopterin synthase sulfur carrier subunit